MTSPRAAALLAPLLLATLVACSTTTDDGAAPGGASPSPSSSISPTWQDFEPGGPSGPLEEILGWSGTSPTAQQFVDSTRETENAIAACMAEQGFEYTPQVPQLSDVIVMPEDPPRGSPEFVAQWGYGILNLPDQNAQGGIQFSSGDGRGWYESLESMSEAEQEAFLTALWGPVTEVTADGGEMREGGCTSSSEPGGADDEHLTAVRRDGQTFLAELPHHSAFDELNAEWAACLREAGFAEASPQLAQQRFSDAFNEFFAAAGEADPWGSEEAKALGVEEIDVATADLACREETDYVARFNEIDLRLQTEYVAANRADLDALTAAAAGVEG